MVSRPQAWLCFQGRRIIAHLPTKLLCGDDHHACKIQWFHAGFPHPQKYLTWYLSVYLSEFLFSPYSPSLYSIDFILPLLLCDFWPLFWCLRALHVLKAGVHVVVMHFEPVYETQRIKVQCQVAKSNKLASKGADAYMKRVEASLFLSGLSLQGWRFQCEAKETYQTPLLSLNSNTVAILF